MAEESIEQLKASVVAQITDITIEKINDLVGIWSNLFEDSIVKQNIEKLVKHVEAFHVEVFEETAERQRSICNRIKELREEQHRLQRMLNTNVNVDVDTKSHPRLFNYQMELDQNLDELRDQLECRQRQVEMLINDEENLCNVLDIESSKRLTYDPLPSGEDIEDFKSYLKTLKLEIKVRTEAFEQLKESIKMFAGNMEIDMKQDLRFGIFNKSDLALTTANLAMLQQLNNALAIEKKEIKDEITSRNRKLQALYTCLEMSPKKEFVNFNHYTKTGITALNAEINRCEKIKRQNIQRVVENVRAQIKEYWVLTLKSNKEISRFPNFTSDCYTDDLLVLHEMELADLKKYYADNVEIFNKFNEHNTLWTRMLALEAKEHEPGRFNNRGGQLLLEEKERKTISFKLPKLRAELSKMAQAYEEEHRRKFLVHGRDLEEVINEVYENRREVKVQQMSARKAGANVATGTAGQRSVSRTPMSASKIGHTSAMKRIASNTNIYNSASTKKHKTETTPISKTVKRNILSQLGAASASAIHKFVKPKPGTKPPKVVDTLTVSASQRRRSRRRSSNKSSKKNSSIKPVPRIVLTDTSHSESVISYDTFENHMSTRTPCRSSVLPKENTPYKLRSPKCVRTATPLTVKASSSRLMLSRHKMPVSPAIKRSPSPRSKKLTTKNLPIII